MESHDHDHDHEYDQPATARANLLLWGGFAVGILLVVLLITHGFGLWAPAIGQPDKPALVHQNGKIFVPEDSPLRGRLAVEPAPTQEKSTEVVTPGIVESDPARTVTILPPGAGRVKELKVTLGDHVQRGQVLALIDSPDLAQAYDDNDKAAAAAALASRFLNYQDAQFKVGASAQRDLDQARSDNQQAVAEYERTREHLRAMGRREDAKGEARLLAVRAPVPGSITTLTVGWAPRSTMTRSRS